MAITSTVSAQSFKLLLGAMAAATLVACGGDPVGGSQTRIVVSDPYAMCDTVTMGGLNATVVNSTTTSPYYLSYPGSSGAIVATGCTDKTTNLALPDMKSHSDNVGSAGKLVVSPLTTLVENVVASKQADRGAAANTFVANFINAPVGDLFKDPVETLTTMQATAKITTIVSLIRQLGGNSGTALNGIMTNAVAADRLAVQIASTAYIAALHPTVSNTAKANLVAALPSLITTIGNAPTTAAAVSFVQTAAANNSTLITDLNDPTANMATSVNTIVNTANNTAVNMPTPVPAQSTPGTSGASGGAGV